MAKRSEKPWGVLDYRTGRLLSRHDTEELACKAIERRYRQITRSLNKHGMHGGYTAHDITGGSLTAINIPEWEREIGAKLRDAI